MHCIPGIGFTYFSSNSKSIKFIKDNYFPLCGPFEREKADTMDAVRDTDKELSSHSFSVNALNTSVMRKISSEERMGESHLDGNSVAQEHDRSPPCGWRFKGCPDSKLTLGHQINKLNYILIVNWRMMNRPKIWTGSRTKVFLALLTTEVVGLNLRWAHVLVHNKIYIHQQLYPDNITSTFKIVIHNDIISLVSNMQVQRQSLFIDSEMDFDSIETKNDKSDQEGEKARNKMIRSRKFISWSIISVVQLASLVIGAIILVYQPKQITRDIQVWRIHLFIVLVPFTWVVGSFISWMVIQFVEKCMPNVSNALYFAYFTQKEGRCIMKNAMGVAILWALLMSVLTGAQIDTVPDV